ncbi:MAG: hypothetical protein GY859_11910, partial [Desulfobacterales bacterium]|nr:hypothetical protein [Desulfobacterales bacterium]
EYMDWLLSREWEGAHPFEIVYSGNVHGITLYPPNKKEPLYRLSVIDPFYNAETIKMAAVFMEHEIPFTVHDLEALVNYCRGESFTDVNKFSMRGDMFQYEHTKEEEEEYFSHIEWEKLQILEAI